MNLPTEQEIEATMQALTIAFPTSLKRGFSFALAAGYGTRRMGWHVYVESSLGVMLVKSGDSLAEPLKAVLACSAVTTQRQQAELWEMVERTRAAQLSPLVASRIGRQDN